MTPGALRARLLAGLAAIVVAALALSGACGDDDSSSATPTQAGTPNPSVNSDAANQVRDLAAKWGTAKTKIGYSFDSALGSLSVHASVVFAQDPPNQRVDVLRTDGAVSGIINQDGVFSCSASNSQGICITSSDAVSAVGLIPFLWDLTQADRTSEMLNSATKLEAAPAKTVTGLDTKCFDIAGPLGGIGGEATWCFSDDGLLLYVGYAKGTNSTFTLEGGSVDQPQASDFELPYEVVTPVPTGTPSTGS